MFPVKETSSEYPSCSLSPKCAACVRDVDFEDGASTTSHSYVLEDRLKNKNEIGWNWEKYERSRLGLSTQWSLQNRAHRAHGPVGVETGPVGKSTTGHKCARLEFSVAHPEISGCPPHTAHFSSIFPRVLFSRGFHLRTAHRQRRSTQS